MDVGLPFCPLLPALEISEVDHGYKHVLTAFGIPDNEEVDVAVTYRPR